jgi:hypothetical protein
LLAIGWLVDWCFLLFCFGDTGVSPQGYTLAKQALTKQALYNLIHTSSPFWHAYFGDGVSQTICPGWPRTAVIPISVSQVARITGMSQQCPVDICFLKARIGSESLGPGLFSEIFLLGFLFVTFLSHCLL